MRLVRQATVAGVAVIGGVLLWAPPLQRGVATAPVVIAHRDIPQGVPIKRTAVSIARWPVGSIPAGAFTSIDSVDGRVTRISVLKGQALVPGRLAPDGPGPRLEVKITPGKRAMSFRIDGVSGIARLIPPNSRVDVVLIAPAGGGNRRVAKLILENMRVLAIGSSPQRSEDGRPINSVVATVEVTPEEGRKLTLATTQGTIQLMLRGYGDPPNSAPDVAIEARATNLIVDTARTRP